MLVFLPLFVLPGIEGRLLRPLGLAYVAALAASLLVSLTVTPVLCYLLLPRAAALDASASRGCCARSTAPTVRASSWSLRHRGLVLLSARSWSPPRPCRPFPRPQLPAALQRGVADGRRREPARNPARPRATARPPGGEALLAFPEVVSTSRRTGRAEKDEHVQGVNASEMEVVLGPLDQGRDKEELLAEMRRAVATIPGVDRLVRAADQPPHRPHDLGQQDQPGGQGLRPRPRRAARPRRRASRRRSPTVPGIVDLSNQEQAAIPQLVIDFDRAAMARHGLTPAAVSRAVEALFQGVEVGEIVDQGITSSVVVRSAESCAARRERLAELPVTTPAGTIIPLREVAEVRFDLGPSLVRREDVQRVAMLTANVAGADLAGTVERARERSTATVELPPGLPGDLRRPVRGGQPQRPQPRDPRRALILAAMYGLLYVAFRSHRETLIVLVNLPLALIGGVFAWPRRRRAVGGDPGRLRDPVRHRDPQRRAAGDPLPAPHDEEGLPLAEAVRRGSRERLAPILMTALTAGLALIPLVLDGGEPGNEIQSPMAQVILGGLLTSTFLNLVVVPVLYERFGTARAAVSIRARAV